MRRSDRNFFTNAGMLTVCGLLSGVVVAAAAFPAVAMSGLAAKAGGESFAALPSELRKATAPQVSRVVAADGKTEIAVFYDEFRSDVPLKDISKNMLNAIVAAEDHKFYKHNGVDLKGVARAIVSNNSESNGGQQGASTLTMQYVRMSLSYSAQNFQEVVDATEDTPQRKLTEMKYAMQVEKELSKEQILQGYLNQAPFGNGAYGISAASQVYFQKKPKDLSVPEAALLAGMVKAPTGFDPTTPTGYPAALDRRNWVIGNMRDLNYITAKQAADATKVKLGHEAKRSGNGCAAVKKNEWGFFCDYFYRWWLSREEFGKNTYDRERRLKSGGYRIQASMDVAATASTRAAVADQIGINNRDALLLAAVQPGTGRVKALAANRRYKLDGGPHPQNKLSSDPKKAAKKIRGTYPNTTNPLLSGGGDITGYQAGSVFKMFTMVAALENGYPLPYTINTTYQYKSSLYLDSGAPAECNGHYCPRNASQSEKGPYNMWSGFGSSVNTYFVPLEESVGAEKVVDVAHRFGVKFRDPHDNDLATKYAHDWGSFTLGVSSSTPLDMANAYATLAADGMYCEPTPVQLISTMTGEKLDVGKPHCKRATTADVARAAIDAARCPVGDSAQLGSCGGHATAAGARYAVGHPIFGKTGTTDNDKTASLIISTRSMTVAGYLVNPDYQNHPYKMRHDVVNPAVEKALHDIMKGKSKQQFKKPKSTKISVGEQRDIPGVKCTSVEEATSRVQGAGFVAAVGAEVASDCPKGQAAGTEPSGRTIKGGFVSIQVSAGPQPGSAPSGGPQPGR
ncbi:transglycosylase domain-containing protein [Actinoplanes sp. TFC3]|uniref:transglycosylase domain-containing protein n=1 Tax=Actinoplanes sp. TFC3 TaxID=1710355 RepID=UPI0008367BAA|nr:transglycosylase domain-containing protein [Actinoplanes sp. TFC3]